MLTGTNPLGILFMFLFGALLNRIRGGFLSVSNARTLNALVFGIAFILCLKIHLVFPLLTAALGMFIGQSVGWGRYIGAVGGWEKNELKEFYPIDLLISPFKRWMRLWGFLGLTLRGFFWGSMLFLGTATPLFIFVGALMGLVYLLTTLIWKEKGWEIGEAIFGGLLWLPLALLT